MTKTVSGISLRTKLFIAFTAMAVFPLLFLNFMTLQTTEQALLKTVFERNRSFANNIADDIDLMFAEKVRMLKVAVNNTDIQSMNVERLVPALSPLTANHHELLMAIVLAPNGDLLARSDGKKTTANYNDREDFRTAMSTGKTTISDVLRSKTTEKLDIGIAEPIKNPDQSIRGMLVIGVSLHKIKERIAMTRIDSSGYAYVVNKNGKVLMHPDQSMIDTSADFFEIPPVKAAVSGQSGSMEYDFNGRRMLASYSYVPSTGWGLVVQEPLDEAMATSTSLRHTNIILMAATILIAVAIVFVLAGLIFKPVAQLTEAVGKVADGDLTTQISFRSSDEIGKLATAFNNLTSQLSREEAARHAAENTSRETSEMFSLFMRHSPVYVFIKEVDRAGSRVLQASDNFKDMVGIAGSEMIGKTMEELFPAQFAQKITADDRAVLAKGNVLKIDEVLNGRSYTTIKFPLIQGDRRLLAGYSIDITDRKQAEEALRQSETTFRKLFEDSSDAILLVDGTGVFVECNQAALDLMKMTREQFLHLPPARISPEFQPVGRRSDEAALDMIERAYSKGLQRFDWTCVNSEGGEFIVDVSLIPVTIKGEVMLHTTWRDITERSRAEQILQLSEKKFSSIVNMMPDMVGITRITDGCFIEVNNGFERWSGWKREEVVGKSSLDLGLWNHETRAKAVAIFKEQGRLEEFEFIMTTKSGEERNALMYLLPIEVQGEKCFFFLGRDVTELKRAVENRIDLEKQILHAQKLESLGVLAGGIAHDFNNLLTAIVGNADLALMRLHPESPAVDNIKRIEQASARAADLAKQMLAYSGKGKFVVEHLDMSRLIEEMLHLLEVSISKKAVLRFNLTHPLPSVEADATQLRQIIMNLVINASEAIGDKSGVIAITTGCMDCDRNYLKDVWLDENLHGGLYVYLEVADSGCGMDKETMGKLFDPFFTTKFTGRGLGMAAVLGIVRGHKGAIKVYSEPGKGTSFKLLFPASGKPAELFNDIAHTDEWKGSGKVLLVDDEETIRGVGGEMLKELGFTVITAEDGKEGVAAFKENPDIDFVILDLTMPHMDGEQCFRELQQLKPDVKVIMSSGFSEQEVSEKFIGKGLAGFIQKPYRLSVLTDAVRNICS